jgi:hypothetical protein
LFSDEDPYEDADRVLRAGDREETVHCSNDTNEHGVVIALFLQIHDDDYEASNPNARARLAWRNFKPRSYEFQRSISSPSARVAEHKRAQVFQILGGRTDQSPYYGKGIVDDAVMVAPDNVSPNVTAEITFLNPPSGFPAKEKLTVAWPERGRNNRCAGCSRSFPM